MIAPFPPQLNIYHFGVLEAHPDFTIVKFQPNEARVVWLVCRIMPVKSRLRFTLSMIVKTLLAHV